MFGCFSDLCCWKPRYQQAPTDIHLETLSISNSDDKMLCKGSACQAAADPRVRKMYGNMHKVHEFFKTVFEIDVADPHESLPDLKLDTKKPDEAKWQGTKVRWKIGVNSLSEGTAAHEYIHAAIDHLTQYQYDDSVQQDDTAQQDDEDITERDALEESCADIFASIYLQWRNNQTPKEASWVLVDGNPEAIYRSLKEPQKHDDGISHYENFNKKLDEHAAAGISNHAFYLAATKLGDSTWKTLGHIWLKAMKEMKEAETFKSFADRTIFNAVETKYDQKVFEAIKQAWIDVGVLKK